MLKKVSHHLYPKGEALKVGSIIYNTDSISEILGIKVLKNVKNSIILTNSKSKANKYIKIL